MINDTDRVILSMSRAVCESCDCSSAVRVRIITAKDLLIDGSIKGWLSKLKDDKRLIVSTTGKAAKAVQLILNDSVENV